jgi:hypothetical protein
VHPSPSAAARNHHAPVPRTTLPGRVFAYSMIGTTVVATAFRVAPAAPGQGPITVVRFDPAHTRLVLHAGSVEPSPRLRWRHGPVVGASERAQLIAAFNGGFKMHDARGGWMSEGRTMFPLVRGAASVVMYADGGVDIGAWGRGVPAPGRRVSAVRQNLQLLVSAGRARLVHPPDQAVLNQWWGHAFQDQALIARSALGITRDGVLVWAAGTDITVEALARAIIAAGAVRAMELDINAPLVRGFLFSGAASIRTRAGSAAEVVPLVVGQRELRHDPALTNPSVAPHCTYLLPCSRDFLTVLAR